MERRGPRTQYRERLKFEVEKQKKANKGLWKVLGSILQGSILTCHCFSCSARCCLHSSGTALDHLSFPLRAKGQSAWFLNPNYSVIKTQNPILCCVQYSRKMWILWCFQWWWIRSSEGFNLALWYWSLIFWSTNVSVQSIFWFYFEVSNCILGSYWHRNFWHFYTLRKPCVEESPSFWNGRLRLYS